MATGEERHVFPAVRGLQAGREYYVAMCRLRRLPKLLRFHDQELEPELRAQRRLNKGRLPEMSRYVLENPESYTFSALTASIDGDLKFTPSEKGPAGHLGELVVPESAKVILNDGQHRRAAIEMALEKNPELGEETIAVVFFHDRGLDRCQQMFSDLNRYAIRPSTSLGILYDHRDEKSELIRRVVLQSEVFGDLVETERSALSRGSRALFTLSALYRATSELLKGRDEEPLSDRIRSALGFWEEVATHLPEWGLVREREMTSGEVRTKFLHSHAIVLNALGRSGNTLLAESAAWRGPLKRLRSIDWSRSNTEQWEGRAMIGGRVSKSGNSVTLTSNVIKQVLGLPLTSSEQRVEDAYLQRPHA